MSGVIAQHYSFEHIYFGAERHGTKEKVDMRRMTPEINIFESVYKSYITANILVYDDADIFGQFLDLMGTETVRMVIDGGPEDEAPQGKIDLEMRVVSLVKKEKVQDRASVYAINCISSFAYDDANGKISKSYLGQLEETAKKVLESNLNVSVKQESDYWGNDESLQGQVKVLIPYISPVESAEWLMERASSRNNGSPYFVWSSVWDQEPGKDCVRFGSLATMIQEGIAKVKPEASTIVEVKEDHERSFIYSIYGRGRTPRFVTQRATIESYTIKNTSNTLRTVNEGSLGSSVANIDTYTAAYQRKHWNAKNVIDEFSNGADWLDTVLDEKDVVTFANETKPLAEHNSRYRNLITSYGTYKWNNSYHDNADVSLLLAKMGKSAWKSLLTKNRLDVVLNGYNFMESELSAGDVVRLVFGVNQTDDISGDYSQKEDERMSGFYFILGVRRLWKDSKHICICDVTRLAAQGI